MKSSKKGIDTKSSTYIKNGIDKTDIAFFCNDLDSDSSKFWELDIAKTKLNKILNSSLDVICAVDANGYFLYVSAACESVWGYKADELVGKPLMDFVYPEDHEKTRAEAAKVMEGNNRIHFENRYVRKDGSLVPITWSARWDENDKIRYGVARDATDKKLSDNILFESEKKYKNLFENNPFPIYIWDIETLRLIDCNEETLLKYGYSREEFLQLTINDLSPSEDLKLNREIVRKEENWEIHKKVWRHRKKNHELMHMEVSGHLISYNNRESFLVMVNDVTKRIEAEERKEFDKINTDALINSTEDLIWSVSCDLKLIVANKAFIRGMEDMTGITLKHGDDLLMTEVFSQEQLEFWKNCYNTALLGEPVKKEVYTKATKNWNESWADISFNPIYKDQAIVGVACYSKNITTRKFAEEQLKRSEARLIEAQGVAKVGSWETDLLTLEVTWSQETYRIFEINPDLFRSSHPDFINFVHPDDREKVDAAFADSFNNNAVNTIEHRIVTPGGNEKIVEESWRIFRDREGQPIKAVGTCQDITERKKAEENIRNSEEKRSLIMNAALDAIICIDTKGDITFWNPQAEVVFGWKENEAIRKPLSELIIPAQYRSRHNAGIAHYLKTGEGPVLNKLLELSAINRRGEEFPIELTIMPIEQGSEVFFCAFIRDITERKKAEKTLQAAYNEKNSVLERIDDGFFAVDKDSLVTYWNKRAEILLEVKREDMLGKNLHEMFATNGPNAFYTNYEKALRENTTVHFEEFSQRTNKWFAVSAYASDNGLSVYFKDVTEQREAEEKLRQSNERYNLISKATNDMVWDWNILTGEVYRNKEGWKKILGGCENGVENGTVDDWDRRIHPDDVEKIKQAIREIKETKKDFFEVECRILRYDGTYAYIHDRGNIIRDEKGNAIRVLGATQDITERKEAAIQVTKSEIRFKSLVQNSSDIISILNERAYYTYCSPAIKKLLGYEPEELIGKNAFSFIHPDDVVKIKHFLNNRNSADNTELSAYRYRNSKGEWRWLESKISDMSVSPEVQGYVFNSRDVTDRKIAEEEIEKLSIIARETVNAVIITDPEEKILWVNEAFTRITEFEPADVLGKRPGDFLQGDETSQAVIRFMRQKIRNVEPFECDVLNYSKSGRKYWLRIQCQPQYDAAGKLKYFFAIETDITKEKEAEQILKTSEERYRYLFDNNPSGIMIWNPDNLCILEVNESCQKMYGYNRKEFLKLNLLDLRLPEEHDKIIELARQLQSNDSLKPVGLWKHIDSAGKLMYMHIASHQIYYQGRKVIMAISNNVTEKILLEEELERQKTLKQHEITEAVISAQEQERQEIGRELHDNINQILASSRLYLSMVKRESAKDASFLEETDNLINTAINEIRNLSHSMIPPSLSESELLEALGHLVYKTSRPGGIAFNLVANNFDENNITDKHKLTIYRIVQEQFNNILKYACAKNVIVELDQDNEKIMLSIKDDGIGFDTQNKSKGVGLMNIKTRASLFNGEMFITSSPGNGCELRVLFN